MPTLDAMLNDYQGIDEAQNSARLGDQLARAKLVRDDIKRQAMSNAKLSKRSWRDVLQDINGFIPVTGDIQSGVLAANDVKQGNYGSAALNGLGLLPFIPSLVGMIASKGDKVADAIRPLTKYELAQQAAQKNAVDMLGLPLNNTAMDRARALGFDTPAYHGTNADFNSFDMGKVGSNIALPLDAPRGIYTAKSNDVAGRYSKGDGANVIPLLQKSKDAVLNNSKIMATYEPSSLRSRFAAFDPVRAHEADILGNATPEMLALLAAGSGAVYLGKERLPVKGVDGQPIKRQVK